jgi:hypothetical protein
MAQILILEGNEGYALSEILKLSDSQHPTGYLSDDEYKKDFLKSVKGVRNVRKTLVQQINDPTVTNVGIIVDANSKGTKARFDSIKSTLNQYLPAVENWDFVANSPAGWVADVAPNFRVGLWVMPNNKDSGYFEHFLTELIDPEDASFLAAQEMLAKIQEGENQRFSDLRARKALLALFLAIQEEPGMSAVTALRKGLLRHKHPVARFFVDWYENTFALG